MKFDYPIVLTRDRSDGGYVVTFPDFPEALTQGNTKTEALENAQDCLEEAVAARISDKEDIPKPSPLSKYKQFVPLPVQWALKAALYDTMRKQGLNMSQLANELDVSEKVVRRLLDPYDNNPSEKLEQALHVLGRRVSLRIESESRRAA